jgi:hypothetical protein
MIIYKFKEILKIPRKNKVSYLQNLENLHNFNWYLFSSFLSHIFSLDFYLNNFQIF